MENDMADHSDDRDGFKAMTSDELVRAEAETRAEAEALIAMHNASVRAAHASGEGRDEPLLRIEEGDDGQLRIVEFDEP